MSSRGTHRGQQVASESCHSASETTDEVEDRSEETRVGGDLGVELGQGCRSEYAGFDTQTHAKKVSRWTNGYKTHPLAMLIPSRARSTLAQRSTSAAFCLASSWVVLVLLVSKSPPATTEVKNDWARRKAKKARTATILGEDEE